MALICVKLIISSSGGNMVKLRVSKHIKNIVVALIICVSLQMNKALPSAYHLGSVIVFGLVYWVLCHNESEGVHREYWISILAAIFAVAFVVGRMTVISMDDITVSLLRQLASWEALIELLGTYFLLDAILLRITTTLDSLKFIEKKHINITPKQQFLISFTIMMVVWSLYFLTYYPGSITPDSLDQIKQIFGILELKDHHPVFHTLLMKAIILPVYTITGSVTGSIATYTVVQMILMALIFSRFISFLQRRSISIVYRGLVLFFFAFSPIFGFYSITLWKDILFGGVFLNFSIYLVDFLDKRNNLQLRDYIYFMLNAFLVLFLRNNAVYMFIVMLPIFAVSFRKFKKELIGMTMCLLLLLVTYFGIKGPVFNAFGIQKSSTSEYIGMPLQQIGRIVNKGAPLTDDEILLIEDVLSIEEILKTYNPIVSDGLKFNPNFDVTPINENGIDYLKLYLELIKKYPSIALESYAVSTVGYWYPNYMNTSVARGIYWNDLLDGNLKTEPKITAILPELFNILESRDTPVIAMQWSIGLAFWFIVYFALMTYYRKQKQYLLVFVPILAMWITMMLASPVNGEFRYVFSAFTTLPLYAIIPFIKKESVTNE